MKPADLIILVIVIFFLFLAVNTGSGPSKEYEDGGPNFYYFGK
jgi:hypothetical protein